MNNRQEQIEQAKRLIATGISEELVEVLHQQFPELKESENERIRKYIQNELACLRASEDNGSERYNELTSAIAYLGRQKEQKPAEWKPQPESLEALMYAIEGKWEAIKPTSYLSRRLEDLYDGLVNTFNVDESFIAHENDYVSKPAEWSEEDEYVYNEILKRVADKKLYEHDLEYIYKWLKSLRPQPHWKPSEEQMEALMLAIEGKCPPTSYMSRRLEDLYEILANEYNVECKLENSDE